MRETLEAAIAAWDQAKRRYEDLLLDEPGAKTLEDAEEALLGAERGVKTAFTALIDGLRRFPEVLSLGIDAQIEIQEHSALQAERRATHGELAGAGHDEREAIARLEQARDALSALTDACLDAAIALEEL